MSQSAFFPVKPVYLYSDRKPRVCQKLGNSRGVGKYPATGQCKIWLTRPRSSQEGGGGGGWAQVELTDALINV